MFPMPMNRVLSPMNVEYTSRGTRVRKSFSSATAARRFYQKMFLAGADPKAIRPQEQGTMSEQNTPAVEAATPTPVARTPRPRNKPAAPKAIAAPTTRKPAASRNGNGQDRTPTDQATKPIRWTPAKIALVETLRKLGATKSGAAVTVGQIVAASKGRLEEKNVKHQLNPAYDMTMQHVIEHAVPEEGSRERRVYLGVKGRTVKMVPFTPRVAAKG